MLKKKNHAGNAPAILPLICAVAALTAFGAGDLMAQARQGSNQDPLFLTATNRNGQLSGHSRHPNETGDFRVDRRRWRG